jgi:hypothetical protein
MVLDKQLSPSIYVNRGDYALCRIEASEDNATDSSVYPSIVENWESHGDLEQREKRSGFHYLIFPFATSPTNGEFLFFSTKPREHAIGDTCHELEQVIDLDDVWKHGVVMATELDRFKEDSSQLEKDSGVSVGRWPWGSHHTETLGHLEAAARRFWVNYDPTDTTTAPTNADVAAWLKSDRRVSKTMAEAIASILRIDGLPTGPRK